nr:reverse transcriptase domain-containing protein [Tanacetum cinerariifolium]
MTNPRSMQIKGLIFETPKEILAAEANKFQPPPPMVTPVEKRNSNKFCDFHNDKGHNTDECMQLKKQIEDDYITDGVQRRDYMAARTAKTPGDHRRRHPFYQSMDELHDCEVVVTLQRGDRNNPQLPIDTCRMCVGGHIEVVVEGSLSDKGRTELCSLLKKNLDIFAWQPSDMTGVPRSVAEHRLDIREGFPSMRQKKRGQAPERTKAIQAEVQKLVEARIMREVYYHDWLSNSVMVKKHDGSWRMCFDFTDLNKACLQDCYPLLEIDWKVESLCGYPFKCFLDAYKGYHQIQLAAADEEKTAFHTGQGVYYYTKMPFGLKNAGATYQRLMDKAFKTEGVFLGYVITLEGVKPCPDKTTAVLQLPSPQTIKEVQSLNGKLASLNRFLFKSAEKSLPLFQTLKKCIKKSDFRWTAEAEKYSDSLVFAAKRLRRYFQTHLITVITDQPIKYVMSRRDVAGRLQKWSIMLGEHNITYRPRTSIKGQILADFLNEMSSNTSQGVSVAETQEEPWTLFIDGLSCVDGSGAGLILTNPDGVEFTYALRFQFAASNNEVEYEALIAGLRIATQMGVKKIQENIDSKLVANQVLGTYVAKEDNMIKYLEITKGLVLVEVLETKSITGKEVTAVIEEEDPTWMTELVNYLKQGKDCA